MNSIPLVLGKETMDAIEKAIEEMILHSTSEIMKGNMTKPYLNQKEACQYIGVSYNTFRKLVKGGLKTVTVEGIEMVRKVDIDEYFEAHVNN